MNLAAEAVRALHMALIGFMLWAPLFAGPEVLLLAESGYVLLFVHWVLNNDACALTMLEQRLRGVDKGQSFVQSVVQPFYDAGGSAYGRAVWAVSLLLFAVGLWRMWRHVVRRRATLSATAV